MPRIVVVGSCNADMVIKVPRLPRRGETVTHGAFFRAHGGKGANQAVAAARAGGRVSLIACLGRDDLGDSAIAAYEEAGVDTTTVRRTDAAPSGVALIFVDADGENVIAVAEGSNALLSPADIRACEVTIASADVLVTQLEIPLDTVAEAVAIAHEHHVRTILNPAPARPLPDDLLSRVSILTPNASEAELLAGLDASDRLTHERIGEALLGRGAGAVLMTLGREGVLAVTREGSAQIPGWPVNAEDTTGAGDVFTGALAAAIAEGAAIGEAARFANAAAAISVTRRGAQPSAPRREEIMHLLRGGAHQ